MNCAKVPQLVLWFLLAVAMLVVDSGRTARAAGDPPPGGDRQPVAGLDDPAVFPEGAGI